MFTGGPVKRLGLLVGIASVVSVSLITLHAQSGAPASAKPAAAPAQKSDAKPAGTAKDLLTAGTFSGLQWRSIGPAVTSGRVIDIAVRPDHAATWYLATVGGVWKTENAGTSWTPVFDSEGSFSIGCVTIDPNNPHVVWVGTGENNSQRSVSYGDGVYRSVDGGKTLGERGPQGLDAHRPDRRRPARFEGRLRRGDGAALVAGRRPRALQDDRRGQDLEGRADDQREHRRQRRRHRPAQPRRALRRRLPAPPPRLDAHRRRARVGASTSPPTRARPGRRSRTACPKEDLGRIGLAVSPANPDVVYAIVEAANEAGGFFRSTDRGASFEKMSGYVSGGPMYYNEIVADPKQRRPRLLDGRLHAGHRGRRPHVQERRRAVEARGQPRALDRPGRHQAPGQRQRRRRLRVVRPRRHLGVQGEPAHHAVLPRRGGQRDAVLQRLRRHAGQLLARRAVAHRHARTASPTTGWFVTTTRRRLRQPRRPRGSEHRLRRIAARRARALRPADRRAGRHPAAGRQGRPAAPLELGLAAHHQPALAHPALHRRAAPLPSGRPRRHAGRRSAAT